MLIILPCLQQARTTSPIGNPTFEPKWRVGDQRVQKRSNLATVDINEKFPKPLLELHSLLATSSWGEAISNLPCNDTPPIVLVFVHCPLQPLYLFPSLACEKDVEMHQGTSNHFVTPSHILGLQLGAVSDLQGAARSAREEVCNLLPCQVLVFLQLHQ